MLEKLELNLVYKASKNARTNHEMEFPSKTIHSYLTGNLNS